MAGTVDSIDVFFSRPINSASFLPAYAIISGPNGESMASTSIEQVTGSRFRINFLSQTDHGTYTVRIMPWIEGVDGTKLDQNRDGLPGNFDDLFVGTFQIVEVDLEFSNVAINTNVLIAGELVTVTWSGRNVSGAPLYGSWTDGVYLSADDQLDAGDELFGTVRHEDGLAQNAGYVGSATVAIPGVLPGDYYILVRGDMRNEEIEGDGEQNNIGVSDQLIPLEFTSLTVDTPLTDLFEYSGQSKYYVVAAPAGEALQVVLDDLDDARHNELYIKYGVPPTRSDYDARYGENLTSDQVLAIDTTAGLYYVLVYAEWAPDVPSNAFTVSAEIRDFLVFDISPTFGGNTGDVTLTFRGAGFADDTMVRLVDSSNAPIESVDTVNYGSAVLSATFDLRDRPTGLCDLHLYSQGHSETLIVTDAFEIQDGVDQGFFANIILPSAVRAGQQFQIIIEYGNNGNTDMVSPMLRLAGPSYMPLGLERDTVDGRGSLQVIAYSQTGPAGILQPGDRERIVIYGRAPIAGAFDFALYSTIVDPLNPSRQLIDWDALEDQYRPPFAEPGEWDSIWRIFTREIGATWDEVVTTLAAHVTETALYGEPDILVSHLLQEQLRLAMGRGGGLTDQDPPWIMTHTVGPLSVDGVDYVEIVFSETIDSGTFTPADILMTDPSGQVILPLSVTQMSDRIYRIAFPGQTALGVYHVLIGPDVGDLVGLEMDQDQDGTHGEPEDDQYYAVFVIVSLGPTPAPPEPLFVTFHSPSGQIDQEEGVDHVIVGLSKPIFSDTFASDDISIDGPAGSVPILAIWKTSSSLYRIEFPRQDEVGIYTMTIGPALRDHDDQSMDQDLDGNDGESGDDEYVGTFEIHDITGPRIVGHSPDGWLNGPVDSLEIHFSEEIEASSFAADDVTLVGPQGDIPIISVLGGTGTVFTVSFAAQVDEGDYTVTIGPDIADIHGNEMDQNRDDIQGGADDVYNGAFHLLPLSLIVEGRITYSNGLDNIFGDDAHVAVQLWEQNGVQDLQPGDPSSGDVADDLISKVNALTGSDLTTWNGEFKFVYDSSNNPIVNIDPEGDGSTRDIYVVVFAKNQNAFVVEDDDLTTDNHDADDIWSRLNPVAAPGMPVGSPANMWSRMHYAPLEPAVSPDAGPQTVNMPITVNDDQFWLSEWVHYGAEWIRSSIGDAPRRQIAIVNMFRDQDGNPVESAGYNQNLDVMFVHPSRFLYPGSALHEYGHAIHKHMIGYGIYSYSNGPYGVIAEGTHTDTTFVEAWASFFAAKSLQSVNVPAANLLPLHVLRNSSLEANDFWMGHDAYGYTDNQNTDGDNYIDYSDFEITPGSLHSSGINYNANSGDIVMGALMSIFWDMADPANDDYVDDLIGLWHLFDIAASDGTVRGIWNRSSQSNQLAAIFIDHGIDVTDDTYEENDTGENGDVTSFGELTSPQAYDGLIMAEESGGHADWFSFRLPASAQDPSDRQEYSISVEITFEGRYGDLDLSVEETTTGRAPEYDVRRGGNNANVTFHSLWSDQEYRFKVCVAGHGVLSDAGSPTGRGGDYNPNYQMTINVVIPGIDLPEEEEELEDEGQGQIVVIRSFDPNDKVGPAGHGQAHFVASGPTMPFAIYYENDPEAGATAAAQEVLIEDQLDSDLDWATFELGDINLFGDYWIDVPSGRNYYQTLIDLRPEGNNLLVRVMAGLDSGIGIVSWLFESLDPMTMELPEDPWAGFLPVNNKSLHNGEGQVLYTIRPIVDLSSGTEITNQAFNTFDINDPVPTPSTAHTIDAGKPTSQVDPLPGTTTTNEFEISWSGEDDDGGSGIASFDIYVSDNGNAYALWNTFSETSTTFVGESGHTYAFYSIATDNVNHVESAPGVPDAACTVSGQTAPSVTVTAPNGGQDWAVGSVHDITWDATDNVGVTSVDLLYSSSGASGSFISIAAGETNDGTYSWTVPDDTTAAALVKVVAHDAAANSAEDVSDGPFTINAQADFSITNTDSQTTAIPGDTVTYTIVVTNNGPSYVTAASITDSFPAILTAVTYTSTTTGTVSGNTAAGAGHIVDTVDMAVGSTITYTVTGTVDRVPRAVW